MAFKTLIFILEYKIELFYYLSFFSSDELLLTEIKIMYISRSIMTLMLDDLKILLVAFKLDSEVDSEMIGT